MVPHYSKSDLPLVVLVGVPVGTIYITILVPPKESVDLHFYGSCGTPWNTFEDFFFKITYILSLICTEVLSVQNVQKKRIKKGKREIYWQNSVRIMFAHDIVYKQCTVS